MKSCPDLGTPENGRKETNETACGSSVDFNCNECYDLIGHKQLSCLPNGTWNSGIPVCACKCFVYFLVFCATEICVLVKSCRSLVAPENGQKSSNDSTCGATVVFDCDECYKLEGNSLVSCLPNQTWSGEEANCTC